MSLAGRVALVTGGGRGIGRAISLALAAEGAAVAVNYRRDEEAAHDTVKAIELAGGKAKAYYAQVDNLEEDAEMVRQMFDRIAPGYDRMNRLMTGRLDQRWRREQVRRLGIGRGDVVLDLATGTGDLAEIVLGTGARVVALDFSRGMLTAGRQRQGAGFPFVQGDGNRLPLADGSISAVVCGFALRNFTSIPSVFAELGRVVKPGGRIALIEVDRPSNPLLRWGHGFYFNRVVPFVGGLLSDRQAYRYLPESAVYLPERDELVRMLVDAGFHRVQKQRLGMGAAQAIRAVRR